MLIVIVLLWIGSLGLLVLGAMFSTGILIGVGIAGMILFPLLCYGLKIVNPNEAMILTLFGNYYGTILKEGFYYVNPFTTSFNPTEPGKNGIRKTVSLKSTTLNNGIQKVNDVLGNPVIIGAVVIWKVTNPTKAVFNIENYSEFLSIQTDSTIRNIATGTYRIYALNDALRSYMHNQPGQEIAYADSLVVPTFEFSTRQDTIWKDTLTIDTIKTVNYTHFMPDNIVLRLFKEKFDRQYMLRPERPTDRMLVVRFNAPLDTLPELTPVNFEPVDSAWYFVQRLEENRAANLWLIDSTVWKQDTLRFSMTYPKSDSLNILRPQTDTLQFLAPRKRGEEKKKKRKEDEPEPIEFLGMSVTNTSGSINLFDTVAVTFAEPVLELDSSRFRLERMIDSVWVLTDFRFFPDTANSLNFYIMRDWKYGENYRLTIDSATIYSAYGKWNDFFAGDFSIKKAEEYGHLYINTPGVEGPAFVELLNSSDTPVRRVPVKDGGALFMDLKPDKYYARMILDTNGNGRWDTGDYTAKRQPEEVFYCPKMFNIMQNWEVEETWDIKALPLKRQKPMDITKNKPKEITKPKRDYRNEGKSSSSSSNSMRGLSF